MSAPFLLDYRHLIDFSRDDYDHAGIHRDYGHADYRWQRHWLPDLAGTPERALLGAIVIQAIHEAHGRGISWTDWREGRAHNISLSAHDWLLSDRYGREGEFYTFADICLEFGVCPKTLRQRFLDPDWYEANLTDSNGFRSKTGAHQRRSSTNGVGRH